MGYGRRGYRRGAGSACRHRERAMRVAVLGTGLMGAPMARRLHMAGHDLSVWNRSPDRALPLADIARIATTPAEAVQDADIVIAMLLDGPATRAVLLDHGVLDAAPPGALIIDMGSVDPETDRALGREAISRGLVFIDAPVSGGVVGAEAGSLSIFVGGNAKDFDRAMPIFDALGRPTHLGSIGAGQTAKLANQVIVAITIGAVAEGLRLAQAGGCDIAATRAALMGGFADSRILDLHGARMVAGDYVPGGRSVAQLKDLDNAAALASENALFLPLSDTIRAGFHDLVTHHDGAELDHSAYFHWLELKRN
ncbi:NAD(P)-dependent oxidoreductase [Gymnodinialimonas sp. 2305UL16-5]|uniref:NAD(P)-dependent oxidoreductase n=1 Tax=Gymnodinialimonas mytili TaxID=3126503 RepID=UPI0030AE54FB